MNAKFVIFSDSCGDLPPNLATEITIIPYIYTLDGKVYYNHLDYRKQSPKEFYDTLRNGKMATTTHVTPQRYIEVWEPILQEGKDILYISLSAKLNKSYEMSHMAAMEMREKYPERTIVTIDSKAVCLGIGMIALQAVAARNEGKTLDETAAHTYDVITRAHQWVMADDLHHLRRGGRVSGASAIVGNLLGIKPIFTMKADGNLEEIHKTRGRDKAFDYIASKLEEYKYDPSQGPIYIAHSDVPDYAAKLQEIITAKYDYKDFVINHIGPVIGAKIGPGAITIVFLGKEKR